MARLLPDGNLDNTFHAPIDSNSRIIHFSLQSDGKILAAQADNSSSFFSGSKIFRLHQDGSIDTSFKSNLRSNIIIAQPNGKILIVENKKNNQPERLLENGDKDTTFQVAKGVNGRIFNLLLQADDKIIVYGDFSSYDDISRNNIARVNVDGSLDTTFQPNLNFQPKVHFAALQPNGKIIILRDAVNFLGATKNGLTRLNTDGSIDSFFNPGSSANGTIERIFVLSNGKIMISGDFTAFNGHAAHGLVLLHTDGSVDEEFSAGLGPNNAIFAAWQQAEDKLIISGDFTAYNNEGRNRIARIFIDPNESSVIKRKSIINLYPNPTRSNITLKLKTNHGFTLAIVTDFMGRKLFQQTLTDATEHLLFFQNLPTGVYLLKLIGTKNNEVLHVAKQ